MIDDYEKLEQLLLQYPFEELSLAQQEWVGEFMSEQVYELQRKVLLESQVLLDEKPALPRPDFAALQAQFKQQQPIGLSFFARPIAGYQALLLAMMVGIFVWFLKPVEVQTNTKIVQTIRVETKTDTLFQEKIIYQERLVYKTKIEYVTPTRDTIYIPFANQESYYQDKKEAINNKKPLPGKSMKELDDLLDFMVRLD